MAVSVVSFRAVLWLGTFLAGLTLAGCAAVTPPPRFSDLSPADPKAPESGVLVPISTLTGGGDVAQPSASEPVAAHAHETAGRSKEAVSYTCPMHPEIKRAAPGKCPICGMTLVRR